MKNSQHSYILEVSALQKTKKTKFSGQQTSTKKTRQKKFIKKKQQFMALQPISYATKSFINHKLPNEMPGLFNREIYKNDNKITG